MLSILFAGRAPADLSKVPVRGLDWVPRTVRLRGRARLPARIQPSGEGGWLDGAEVGAGGTLPGGTLAVAYLAGKTGVRLTDGDLSKADMVALLKAVYKHAK